MLTCSTILGFILINAFFVNKVSSDGRIINGVIMEPHSVPFQIYIEYQEKQKIWRCGGVVYDEVNVVTAAHCCYGTNHTVYGGVHNLKKMDSNVQRSGVEKIRIHELYDGDLSRNDVCMLQLEKPFIFNRYVQPAKLPRQDEPIRPYAIALATGWGRIDNSKTFPEVLMGVVLSVLPSGECEMRIGIKHDPFTMVCAGDMEGKGICNGDSGGPLTVDNTVVGISSWGSNPCGESPGNFARVARYINWLKKNKKAIKC